MGKNKAKGGLGKSIIRDRFGGKPSHAGTSTHLHTSELDDGYDWNRINLRSVTEETSMEEFLATAQMAGTEFIAERMNVKFVSEDSRAGLLSAEEETKMKGLQKEHRELLRIPRRPQWDENTTAQELDMKERESFLEWRRQLAVLQDVEGIVMTPFERNLDFWRQLWRVTERSDIVVQIVDARNPLLFRSKDLEQYVKEVGSSKINMILINKADFLSQKQREMWASYFAQEQMRVAFWSATLEKERLKEEAAAEEEDEDAEEEEDSDDEEYETEDSDLESESVCEEKDNDTEKLQETDSVRDANASDRNENDRTFPRAVSEESHSATSGHQNTETVGDATSVDAVSNGINEMDTSEKYANCSTEDDGSSAVSNENEMDHCYAECVKNNPEILLGPELIELFQSLHTGKKYMENTTTIGLVGYPNVGKSSTINALLQTKKVPVSATPGRTKHFQTLFLDKTLLLCDCPGLVMPSFVSTKSEMVLNGILPIDQMRDYVSPVALLATLIPRGVLESTYGIMIPKPREGEDENRPPTAHELLGTYGYMRGFMTHKGIPDFQKSSRHVLKDFVTGKLLYCNPPPGGDVEEFIPTPAAVKTSKDRAHPQQAPVGSRHKEGKTYTNEIDKLFFETATPGSGTKGSTTGTSSTGQTSASGSLAGSQQSLAEKPWKRHNNRGKKEKLRRMHSYLDA